MSKYMLERGNVFESDSEKETQLHTDINKLLNNCDKAIFKYLYRKLIEHLSNKICVMENVL